MHGLSGNLSFVAGVAMGVTLVLWPITHATSLFPAVRITSLEDGMKVSGVVPLVAEATGPGVFAIQFQIAGRNVGPEVSSGTCAFSWDSRTVSNGTYPVVVRARDRRGGVGVTLPVFITVVNDSPRVARPR